MAESSTANQKYLQGYLAWLRNEKQYSKLTAENYARDLKYLFDLSADTPLADIKIHHIRRYIAKLHSLGLGGRSLARMLSAWRGFFSYLMRDHGFSGNPCAGLRAPKSPKTLPQALSPDEAARMVDLPTDSPESIRDKAMFELFYSSGLRLAELVGLDPEQLDLNAGEVRVTGKGNKTRIVPLGHFAIDALKAWLAVREQIATKGEEALFVGQRGSRISPRVVQLRMKAWGVKQGIPSMCIRIYYVTRSQPMCCNRRATCGQFRKCSAMPAFPPLRCIPISIFSISARSTTKHTPAPEKTPIRSPKRIYEQE